MAPKKKQRTSGGNEVPAVQASLDKWLQTLYELRHAEEDQSKPAVHPWPVLHGGTFLDVACRGWKDLQCLVTSVHKLVVRAELMDADSSETEFLSKYCKMEAGCCRVSGLSSFTIQSIQLILLILDTGNYCICSSSLNVIDFAFFLCPSMPIIQFVLINAICGIN